MPRKPIDYSKAIIYKIVCNDLNIKECYYGSTTDFKSRKHNHKSCCDNINNKEYNAVKYQFIRVNGGWDNWNMVLVKTYPCKSKLELLTEERRCMEQDYNRLNVLIPSRTQNEWNNDNKDYHKKWYENNKENYKEMYEKNKELYKNLSKKNYDKNKNKINQKIDC